jgi:hypothetical protein
MVPPNYTVYKSLDPRHIETAFRELSKQLFTTSEAAPPRGQQRPPLQASVEGISEWMPVIDVVCRVALLAGQEEAMTAFFR